MTTMTTQSRVITDHPNESKLFISFWWTRIHRVRKAIVLTVLRVEIEVLIERVVVHLLLDGLPPLGVYL